MPCNNSDRRQWRKQGAVVGAAASEMQADAKQLLGAATRISCPKRKLPVCRPAASSFQQQGPAPVENRGGALFAAEKYVKLRVPLKSGE